MNRGAFYFSLLTSNFSLPPFSSFSFGRRPDFLRASDSIHSICPLVLRNSSAAHFSMAANISASTRKAKLFFISEKTSLLIFQLSITDKEYRC